MYTALKGYNAREGHGRVPWNHDEGGLRLGVWLSLQWTDQRAGRMSRAREIKLANAGVDWRAPPPPLRSTVSPDHENERKWDQGRAVVLAERHAARAIAAGRDVKPDVRPFDDRIRAWDRHWQPYSAATDIHTATWRRRVMAPPPPLPPPASKAKEPGARRTRTPPADSRQAARAQAADESGKSRPASQAAGAGVGSHAHPCVSPADASVRPGAAGNRWGGSDAPCAVLRRQRAKPLSAVPRSTLYPLCSNLHGPEVEGKRPQRSTRVGAGLPVELQQALRGEQGLPPARFSEPE